MDISSLLELNTLAKNDAQRYSTRRALYTTISQQQGRHFVGIVGPRGVGKTILLKQLAQTSDQVFYISVDTIKNESLFDIAKHLSETYKIQRLLLDEIHFKKDFEQNLKQIFDFLNIHVIFTSSVALAIVESSYDLSRRVELKHLYPFTFREYLLFKNGTEIESLTLDQITHDQWTSSHASQGHFFDEYLKGGLYPFSLEEPRVLPLFENILQKIIQKDIPSVAKLHTDEISLIEKTVEFIGKSSVDGINFSSISRNIGITKYKAQAYVSLLEKAFVLNPIYPIGANVLKEPKILMAVPYRLLYKSFDECIGALREDFFAQTLKMKDILFSYLKTTRGQKTPDYWVDTGHKKLIVEIGGRAKGHHQFKGIATKEKLVLAHTQHLKPHQKPLFLLGFI